MEETSSAPEQREQMGEEEEEEEYVFLDLNSVSGEVYIPPNAPYVLSIGEYEETIGTCLVFSESDAGRVVHEETGPSETNLFSGKCIIDPKQTPVKKIKPVAQLHKILKFRLFQEGDTGDAVGNASSN